MRRGDLVMKIITVIVFLAIAFYIGYYFYDARTNPLKTALAVEYTAEKSAEVSGYVVREEKVLHGNGENVSVTAAEGEKIAAEEAIAVIYQNADSLARATEIQEVTQQIAQLDALLGGSNAGSKAKDAALDLAYLVSAGDFGKIDETLLDVSSYIFTSDENQTTKELGAQREELRERLEQLKSEADTDTVTICAENAGTFSAVVDGFEYVGLDSVAEIRPDRLADLFATPMNDRGDVLGKLIDGNRWYYAAVMQREDADRLRVGDSIRVRLSSVLDEALSMRVEEIGPDVDGEQVVVFSCIQYLSQMTTVRSADAEVIFSSAKGLRVPKEAVHLDDEGQPYVYVLTGLQARVAEVEILGETDAYYIVNDTGTEKKLYEGSEVIVRANDLFDGKVVE